jgi:hypothetical protein
VVFGMPNLYKKGDKVKIRKDLKVECHYGGVYFNTKMGKYRGKTFTIIQDFTFGDRHMLNTDDSGWIFSEEMFEPIDFTVDL